MVRCLNKKMYSRIFLLFVVFQLGFTLPQDKPPNIVQIFPVTNKPNDKKNDDFLDDDDGDRGIDMWLPDLPTPPTPPAVRKPSIDAAAAIFQTRNGEKVYRYLLFTGDKILIYEHPDFDNISNIPDVVAISERFPGFPTRTPVDAVTVHPSGDGIVLIKGDSTFVYTDINSDRPRKVSETGLSVALKHNCRGLMADLQSPIDAIVDHDKDWSTCIFVKNRTVHHNLARWEKRAVVDVMAMFLKYFPVTASLGLEDGRVILFSGNRYGVVFIKENGGYWEKMLSVMYKVKDFREANDAYVDDKDKDN